ncbi:MAG: glycine--tRNA ligase subunit beta, partial [Acidobacteriota bacterium]
MTERQKVELLVEVRAEEMPPRLLPKVMDRLRMRCFEALMSSGLAPDEMVTGFTRRRLVLGCRGLPDREVDREERVLGPSVAEAYDDAGEPTAALSGFAERVEVEIDKLDEVQTEKGRYLGVVRQIPGRSARDVLVERLPELLADLGGVKTMRWGAGEGPWLRPVRGLIVLYDGEVLPVRFCGIEAGRMSEGHPVSSPESFEVTGFDDFAAKLAERGIELSFDERRRRLTGGFADAATAAGGALADETALLERLAAQCEIPGVVAGRFDKAYLALPREVVLAALRHHPGAAVPRRATESDDQLLPAFVTMMDRATDPKDRVRKGYERTVAGALADVSFYLDADAKEPLATRSRRLEHRAIAPGLGTWGAKVERVRSLVGELCESLDWSSDEIDAARQAAELLEVDRTTSLVRALPQLGGVAGGIYARREGYPEAVWRAIYDRNRPEHLDDPLPSGRVGQLLGIADRLDTLVGVLGNHDAPLPRRKDPHRLRPLGLALARLLVDGDVVLDIDLIAARSALLWGERLDRGAQTTVSALRSFLLDRLRHLLGERGYAFDEIEAAIALRTDNLPDLVARIDALQKSRNEPFFRSLVLAAKRIVNMLGDAPEHPLD